MKRFALAVVALSALSAPALALLWLFYLSLVVAGQIFMGYQWDALLLETGFLAIFFAPPKILPGTARETEPARVVLWLFRLLLFRLMLGSALVKLASGDPRWANLTALSYHYETQPIPTPLGWYAFQLPMWFQVLSTAGVFFIEGVLPFLIFAPFRRLRLLAAGGFIFLQLLIALTGNYTFFNLLTMALCILLLDDGVFARWSASGHPVVQARPERDEWRTWAEIFLAALIVFLSCIQFGTMFISIRNLPERAVAISNWLAPFRLVNRYGLFAVMTITRPEIIVEGSNDGVTWLEYQFPYKAGDVTRAPPWVAPYQPRLDWQMWFAALGAAETNPWFGRFMEKLSQGSPEVLKLLAYNPFPDEPPRYLRAVLYDYRFTDWQTRLDTGAWWERRALETYYPTRLP